MRTALLSPVLRAFTTLRALGAWRPNERLHIDPKQFLDSAIDAETLAATEAAMAAAATMPANHELTPQAARERRRKQYTAVHEQHFGSLEHARREDRTVTFDGHSVGVSVFRPESAAPLRGAGFFYFRPFL